VVLDEGGVQAAMIRSSSGWLCQIGKLTYKWRGISNHFDQGG
jgi:hypothetical protein